MKILLRFQISIFYLNMFSNVIYFCDQSWIVSIITSVFSVTWSFRNHSNMMICCWSWKQFFFQDSLMNRKLKRTAFIWNWNLLKHYKKCLMSLLISVMHPCWIKTKYVCNQVNVISEWCVFVSWVCIVRSTSVWWALTYDEDADSSRQHQWTVIHSTCDVRRLLLTVSTVFILDKLTENTHTATHEQCVQIQILM